MNVKRATWFFLISLLLTALIPLSAAAAQIFADDGASGDRFGNSVAIFDYYAAVGASGDDDYGSSSGSVYIYHFDGSAWLQQSKLPANAILPPEVTADSNFFSANDLFGEAVDMIGNYLVVGAEGDDFHFPTGTNIIANVGSAYVFRWNGTSWEFLTRFRAKDMGQNNHFGSSVGISGQFIISGAPNNGVNGTQSGAAYIFAVPTSNEKVNTTELIKIKANDGSSYDFFGTSVAISDDYAVVGAPGDGEGGLSQSGSAYVFSRSGSSWNQFGKLTIDTTDAEGHDKLGTAVGVSGETVIVGAPGADLNDQGAAYVFNYNGTDWVSKKITAPAPDTEKGFGKSVSISGSYAVIGADSGSTYLYKLLSGTWTLQSTVASVGDAADIYGYFAIAGSTYNGIDEVYIERIAAAGSLNFPPTIVGLGDQTLRVKDSITIPFSVYDAESTNLTVTTDFSSPDGSLTAGDISVTTDGSGSMRDLIITSSTDNVGTGQVKVTVSDGSNQTSSTFKLTVNDPPRITPSPLPDGYINERINTGDPGYTIDFNATDTQTAVTDLKISTLSSNTNLVPNSNIRILGTTNPRTLVAEPVQFRSGQTDITLYVTDDSGNTATESFTLFVNDVPSITGLPNSIVEQQSTTANILTYIFEITDAESAGNELTVSATSSKTTLATADVQPAGTINSKQLTITILAGKAGTATITVKAEDPDGAVGTHIISLEVTQDEAPHLAELPTDVVLNQGENSKIYPFTVTDADTNWDASAGVGIDLSASSANTTCLPNANLYISKTDDPDPTDRTFTFQLSVSTFSNPSSCQTTVTVTATDNDATTANDTHTFNFTFNMAPSITPIDNITMEEDGNQAVNFTIQDVETPITKLIGNLVVTADNLDTNPDLFPTNLVPNCVADSATNSAQCTLGLIPEPNGSGFSTITITVTDDMVTTEESFQVTVNPVNDPPEILSINNGAPVPAINEDGSITIPVTVRDVDGDNLTVSIVNTEPYITGPPELFPINFNNININGYGISYRVQNLTPENPTATLDLTLKPMPDANSDIYGPATISLNVKDDPNTQGVYESFQVMVTPINDLPVIQLTNSSFTMMEDPENPVSIPIQLKDADGDSIRVTVVSSNQGLIPTDPANLTFEGENSTTIDVDTIIGEFVTRNLMVMPLENQNGQTIIDITATELNAAGTLTANSVTKSLTILVTAVNDPPIITGLKDLSTVEDYQETFTFTVTDPELEELNRLDSINVSATWGNPAITGSTNMSNGTVNILKGPDGNGTVILEVTPPANESGYVQIYVTASDGELSTTDSFRIDYAWENDLPEILNLPTDSITNEDTPVDINFSVKDVETLSQNLILGFAWESLQPVDMPKGSFSYTGPSENNGEVTLTVTPPADRFGTARISVSVTDGEGATTTGTVDLTIHSVNDPPEILPDPITEKNLDEDTTLDVLFTARDIETLAQYLGLTVSSSNQNLFPNSSLNPNCTTSTIDPYLKECVLTLKPTSNKSGTADITLHVRDFEGGEDAVTFAVTVNEINDMPTFELLFEPSRPVPMKEDTARFIYYEATDIETPESVSIDPAWLWYSPDQSKEGLDISLGEDANGTFMRIIPPTDESGYARISVAVTDGTDTINKTFEVYVEPVNDNPTITIGTIETEFGTIEAGDSLDEDTKVTINFTIGDKETAPDNLTIIYAGYWNGSAMGAEAFQQGGFGTDRWVVFTPKRDQAGTAKITIIVIDEDNGRVQDSVQFLYLEVNDPPTLVMEPHENRITMEEDAEPKTVNFRVNDVDTPIQDLLMEATSSNTTLLPDPLTNLYFSNDQGYERTLTIHPPENAYGTSIITVRVYERNDPESSSETTFELVVTGVNDPPSISAVMQDGQPVSLVQTDEDHPVTGLTVMVNDPDTEDIDSLIMGYTWEAITGREFVNGTITFQGTGTQRTFTITPDANDFGEAQITIMVKDRIDTPFVSSQPFTLKVFSVNDLPTIILPIPGDPAVVYAPELSNTSVKFEVRDVEDPVGQLKVAVQSSDMDLLPPQYITLKRLDPPEANLNYEVVMSPNAVKAGGTNEATVTIFVLDTENGEAQDQFTLVVTSTTNLPLIQDLADQQMPEDTTKTIRFWVWDRNTSVENLTVEASSSDTGVIPDEQLTLTRLDPPYAYQSNNYELVIRPAQNVPLSDPTAKSVIMLRVINDQGSAVTDEFTMTVTQVNDPPTISEIRNLMLFRNQSDTISFTVNDLETAPENLKVTVISSNPGVVPNNTTTNLVLDGSGMERTLKIVPTEDVSGNTNITVTVDDNSGVAATNKASSTFTVTVGELAPGDIDGDGELGLGDVIAALQVVAGIVPFNANVEAEPSGNNKIDMVDALMLLQHVAGSRTIQ